MYDQAMHENELADQLAKAGLIFLGWPDDSLPRVPGSVARYAVSCGNESDRTDVNLNYSDTRWKEGANSAWFELSVSAGLFGQDQEFLVAITLEPEMYPVPIRWAWVRLAVSWDIAGEGAAGPLGGGRHLPEFVMLSLDGEVIVRGTVWQDGIGFLAVRNPGQSPVLRQQAESVMTWHRSRPEERLAARRWLDAGAA
ncbi:hypothetical protein GCM10009531_19590 [Actinoplanes capillaceus]